MYPLQITNTTDIAWYTASGCEIGLAPDRLWMDSGLELVYLSRVGLKVGTYAAHSGHGVDMGLCF